MATRRRVAALALAGGVAVIVLESCGGAVLSDTPSGEVAGDAGMPREGSTVADAAPLDTTDPSTDAATAGDSALPDATASPVCAPVMQGCFGFMSCAPSSGPMPLACAGGTTCAVYCKAHTNCPMAGCWIDGGSFTCYSCNP